MADTVVDLAWKEALVFEGTSAEAGMVLDSEGKAGPSPVEALAFGLAGCMAMDVASILAKGRLDVSGIQAHLVAERAEDHPRRFVNIDLRFTVEGDVPDEKVERALALSRQKYCSVWHSMRQDIPFTTSFSVVRPDLP